MSKLETKTKLTPSLCFPEFSGAWEAFSLLKLSQNGFSNGVFNDPLKVGRGYKLINVKDMYLETYINESELTLVDIDNNEFHRNQVEPGDIFFTRSSLVKEGIARSNVFLGKSGNVTFDGHLIRMRPDRQYVLPIFLNYLLKTQYIRKQLVVRGNTTTMTTIGQKEISEVIAIIPQITEQQKIATFLTSVDDWIENLKKQKEAQEKYKKGMMQKIFSQEIRFRDEQGKDYPDWEEKRLGVLGDIYNGLTGKSGEDFGVGEPFITYKQIFDNSEINTTRFSLVRVSKHEKQNRAQFGDIFFTTSSETPNEVGFSSVLLKKDYRPFLNSFSFGFRPSSNLNPYFAKFLFRSPLYRKKIVRLAQGSTRYNISKISFSKEFLGIPSIEEQQKIADFLSSIDDLINLSNQRITLAEEWKKGLMQRMFV